MKCSLHFLEIVPPISTCILLNVQKPIFDHYQVYLSPNSHHILDENKEKRIQFLGIAWSLFSIVGQYYTFKDGREADDFKSIAFFADCCIPILTGWFFNYLDWHPTITLSVYFFRKPAGGNMLI